MVDAVYAAFGDALSWYESIHLWSPIPSLDIKPEAVFRSDAGTLFVSCPDSKGFLTYYQCHFSLIFQQLRGDNRR